MTQGKRKNAELLVEYLQQMLFPWQEILAGLRGNSTLGPGARKEASASSEDAWYGPHRPLAQVGPEDVSIRPALPSGKDVVSLACVSKMQKQIRQHLSPCPSP